MAPRSPLCPVTDSSARGISAQRARWLGALIASLLELLLDLNVSLHALKLEIRGGER